MNIKRLSIATVLLSSLVVSGAGSVFAASQDDTTKIGNLKIVERVYENPVEYDFTPALTKSDSSKIGPLGNDMTGTVYEMSKKDLYKSKSYEADIENDSSENDSFSRKVTRKTFVTGKIGGSAETKVNWRIIEGKVGISAEVAFGQEDTVETTHTWVIPKRTITTVEYGSKAVKTTGSIVEYFQGRVTDSNYVNVKYSYKEYSSKKSKDL
ncbi:hypothetical protein [Brevibacillus brevis]|uniref:hypothetical protein n=1 Tax=Brevibacillus brevis TaxID=1393 RepID=UPI000D0E4CA0|nr:hypothetical protein [Brevibacillus brevis]PSJ66912.1 hypothetical protein C7J99_24295 [Brevibacillus brevis]RED36060.1 hypothetical protein DES34_101730 [Brevibacillus brevis]GEC88547.1 hypothetical protein BBR01nite_08780 [Brevibacillus brevis]VEF88830.1 Uncharacterised protein [Brevibacillus brevis]